MALAAVMCQLGSVLSGVPEGTKVTMTTRQVTPNMGQRSGAIIFAVAENTAIMNVRLLERLAVNVTLKSFLIML